MIHLLFYLTFNAGASLSVFPHSLFFFFPFCYLALRVLVFSDRHVFMPMQRRVMTLSYLHLSFHFVNFFVFFFFSFLSFPFSFLAILTF